MGNLNREWEEVRLSDISIGNKGSYGIAASAVEYSKKLFTYLRITDITDDGILIKEGLKSVDDSNAEKYILKPNDIVFARTGNSTGRSYFYDGSDGELVYAGFLIKFSLDHKKVNPKYMRYYTLSAEYNNWVDSFKTGSTRGNINAQTYGNMKIKLPPRGQQDFLVSILSTLDEKIETNNQINKTLEKMAQSLFKHWFVDFGFPDENGEPYKSSGGEMVDSELGMIPKGWEVKELDELCKQIKPGTNYQPKRIENGIPFLNVRNINKGYIDVTDVKYISEDDYKKVHSSWIPEKDDVLISRIGTLGLVSVIRERHLPLAVHYNFIDIKSNKVSHQYLYFMLKSDFFQQQYHGIKKASVQEYVTIAEVKKLKVIIPSILKDYLKLEETFNCLFNKIEIAQEESLYITNLRDLLLPKLMSGEIRVPLEGVDN